MNGGDREMTYLYSVINKDTTVECFRGRGKPDELSMEYLEQIREQMDNMLLRKNSIPFVDLTPPKQSTFR